MTGDCWNGEDVKHLSQSETSAMLTGPRSFALMLKMFLSQLCTWIPGRAGKIHDH